MPNTTEIYQNNSFEYDELVNKEDFQGNLSKLLLSEVEFTNKQIIEFGAGTGRVTKIYADKALEVSIYDRSMHMLDRAKINLSKISTPISMNILDNLYISTLSKKADIVIEGWSFGHTVIENNKKIEETIEQLVNSCKGLLKANGNIIIIETLGTNTKVPMAPIVDLSLFYSLLEKKYNFKKFIVNTDYKFETYEDAKRIMNYFFGNSIGDSLHFSKKGVVKEYTGVWIYKHEQYKN